MHLSELINDLVRVANQYPNDPLVYDQNGNDIAEVLEPQDYGSEEERGVMLRAYIDHTLHPY